MSIGKRIRDLRKEIKITQEELGKVLNVGKSTISQYENDVNKPDLDTLKQIADFFDVSVDYILGRIDTRSMHSGNFPTKAYHNLDESGLSDEDIEKVEEYIELLKQKYNPDGSLKKKK